jgi:2-dehydropantoate 2-reductase
LIFLDQVQAGKTVSDWWQLVVKEVPSAAATRFDYIVVTTKNVPDVAPTVSDIIANAVTPGHTAIVLIQNGLNIEKAIFARYPNNVCLSGVSMIGSQEISPGVIVHDDHDVLSIGAFRNTNLHPEHEDATAKQFVSIYSAGGKTQCEYTHDVAYSRWRKLVYNATINSVCAVTGLDTGQIRLAGNLIPTLVLPAMEEIRAAAKANGVALPADICDTMVNTDPITMYWVPSMLADIRKV